MAKCLAMLLFVAWLSVLPAFANTDLDGWRIVRVSAADRVAVAKAPDGELRLVRVGDRLGERITVTGFDADRIVLEQPGDWGRVTLFVTVAAGRQQIARLERQPLRKSDVAGDPAVITVRAADAPKGL